MSTMVVVCGCFADISVVLVVSAIRVVLSCSADQRVGAAVSAVFVVSLLYVVVSVRLLVRCVIGVDSL